MADLRFGTDGVRGRAYEQLTLDLAYRIARAGAAELGGDAAVIGRDTRESGPDFVDAIARGLVEGGVRPLDIGVAPTPAVAATARARAAMGIMVSASHNPWFDNGIKLFDRSGSKLNDSVQVSIEARLDNDRSLVSEAKPVRLESIQSDLGDWVRQVVSTVDPLPRRLSVVVDAGNGAASHVAAPALSDLGLDVEVLHNEPDGRNINDRCGSTDTSSLATAVVDRGADLGLAFDGDADRLVCVDGLGRVVDGDQLMAILALDLRERGRLNDDVVVVTVMSNLGFHRAMERARVRVEVTPVGDRHILEALTANRWSFGGEQSGHLIFADLATTGDGLLSAVQLIDVVARHGSSLAELAEGSMQRFPQILRNVATSRMVADPAALLVHELAEAEARLGGEGRVLVRASGTEPVVRVMVEAADADVAAEVCDTLCVAVVDRLDGDAGRRASLPTLTPDYSEGG